MGSNESPDSGYLLNRSLSVSARSYRHLNGGLNASLTRLHLEGVPWPSHSQRLGRRN